MPGRPRRCRCPRHCSRRRPTRRRGVRCRARSRHRGWSTSRRCRRGWSPRSRSPADRRGRVASRVSPTRWRVTWALSATAVIETRASSTIRTRSTDLIDGGCCGSLTRDSIARPSSRSPSRSVPRRMACARRLSRSLANSLGSKELRVGGDHRHRVVDLVGELAQEAVAGLLELAQLLEQAALALGGVGVGDGPAEVVAELEGGDPLAVGPAPRPGPPRAHQHAEHLVVHPDRSDDDGLEAGGAQRLGEPARRGRPPARGHPRL